jgi:hypothetical protein
MKHLLWAIPVTLVAIALIEGRDDIRRLRAMTGMSRD